ncbi:MAG: hypothetical protein A3F10_00965 [Coxiella sp. RIFCSPHIGHO2_12_FULL_42_15]|nr:MAG: hypothetical protein A3F10_00965 [Coxiella sp. RIFCSPHIGHO2_12_FULL_42_15]
MRELNLLPWREEREKKQKKKFILHVIFVVASTGLLSGVVYYGLSLKVKAQAQKNQRIEANVLAQANELRELRKNAKKIETIKERLQKLQILQYQQRLSVKLFNDLSAMILEGVTFSKVERKGSAVTFEGQATSNHWVAELIQRIHQLPGVTHLTLQETLTNPEDQSKSVRFKIQFNLLEFVTNPIDSSSKQNGKEKSS